MRLVVSVGCDWLDRVEMQCLDEVWSVFKWLINFWISFGIRILRTLAALLKVEMENRPEEITLTSSGLFLEGLIFLLPRSFLRRSFLWLWIFCSNVFSLFFCGLLSAYWAKSVSLSFSVPKFRIYVMRTLISGLLGSFYHTAGWADLSNSASWSKNFVEPIQIFLLSVSGLHFLSDFELHTPFAPWYRPWNALWQH